MSHLPQPNARPKSRPPPRHLLSRFPATSTPAHHFPLPLPGLRLLRPRHQTPRPPPRPKLLRPQRSRPQEENERTRSLGLRHTATDRATSSRVGHPVERQLRLVATEEALR